MGLIISPSVGNSPNHYMIHPVVYRGLFYITHQRLTKNNAARPDHRYLPAQINISHPAKNTSTRHPRSLHPPPVPVNDHQNPPPLPRLPHRFILRPPSLHNSGPMNRTSPSIRLSQLLISLDCPQGAPQLSGRHSDRRFGLFSRNSCS